MFSGHITCSCDARKDNTRTNVQKPGSFLSFFKDESEICGHSTLSCMFFIFSLIKKHSVAEFLLPLFIVVSTPTRTPTFVKFMLISRKTKGAFLLRKSAL